MTEKKSKTVLLCIAALLFAALLAFEIFGNQLFKGFSYPELVYSVATRAVGGVACLIFIFIFLSSDMFAIRISMKNIAVFLPCMAVAINNFPFIPFFCGEAYLNYEAKHILLYALMCLCIGFFEEMAFRGCIFTVLLGRRGKRFTDVFWAIVLSSAIFGAVHAVNILAGASPSAVLLQIGYSFLIGGMCSVVLIKTSSIWYCVILHATYNFAGGVVPECGGGTLWTVPEIVLTAVIAVAVAAYVIYLLIGIKPSDVDNFLKRNTNSEQADTNIEE